MVASDRSMLGPCATAGRQRKGSERARKIHPREAVKRKNAGRSGPPRDAPGNEPRRCDLITRADVEAILGVPVAEGTSTPAGGMCRFTNAPPTSRARRSGWPCRCSSTTPPRPISPPW